MLRMSFVLFVGIAALNSAPDGDVDPPSRVAPRDPAPDSPPRARMHPKNVHPGSPKGTKGIPKSARKWIPKNIRKYIPETGFPAASTGAMPGTPKGSKGIPKSALKWIPKDTRKWIPNAANKDSKEKAALTWLAAVADIEGDHAKLLVPREFTCFANNPAAEEQCENRNARRSRFSCEKNPMCHWGRVDTADEVAPKPRACSKLIKRAKAVCRPFLKKMCPLAKTAEDKRMCFMKNRSVVPKTCRRSGLKVIKCFKWFKNGGRQCVRKFGKQLHLACKSDVPRLCPIAAKNGFYTTFKCMLRRDQQKKPISPMCRFEAEKRFIPCVEKARRKLKQKLQTPVV